jgi:hypothetical protein
MAAGDIFRITLASISGYGQYANTWHLADDSGGSHHIDPVAAAEDWWSDNATRLTAAAVESIRFISVTCQCIAGGNIGDIGVYTPTAGNDGTFGAPNMPPEITISVTRKIPKAGRKYRGRIFWGPTSAGMYVTPSLGSVDVGNAALLALCDINTSSQTLDTVSLDPVLVHGSGKPVVYTRTPGIITTSVIEEGNTHRRKRRDKSLPV